MCAHWLAEQWMVSHLRVGDARHCDRTPLFVFHDTDTVHSRSVVHRSRSSVSGGMRAQIVVRVHNASEAHHA